MRKFAKKYAPILLKKSGVLNHIRKRNALVVLMLHKVNPNYDPLPLTLKPEYFEKIICELKNGHEIICIEDVLSKNGLFLNGKNLKFAITFDDGYRDNYDYAYPILKKYNVPATIYLSVNHINGKQVFWYERIVNAIQTTKLKYLKFNDLNIGELHLNNQEERNKSIFELNNYLKTLDSDSRELTVEMIINRIIGNEENVEKLSKMLTWEMVDEMLLGGIKFGSHTLSHPILSNENQAQIRVEVQRSKDEIENRTGRKIETFAYPNGTINDINDVVIKEVKSAGYVGACTTIPGLNTCNTDVYMLHRVNIHNGMCSDGKKFIPELFWSKILSLL